MKGGGERLEDWGVFNLNIPRSIAIFVLRRCGVFRGRYPHPRMGGSGGGVRMLLIRKTKSLHASRAYAKVSGLNDELNFMEGLS